MGKDSRGCDEPARPTCTKGAFVSTTSLTFGPAEMKLVVVIEAGRGFFLALHGCAPCDRSRQKQP